MGALIEINQVEYTYTGRDGTVLPALNGVSLNIAEGEFVAIVGSNGSGKTTLARLLNGLLLPTAGTVRVAGLDTRDPSHRTEIHTLVGMVFQYPEDQIVATLVEEDVAFGPENLGLPPDEIRERVQEALTAVGLWEYRTRPPHMLSGGQMQRLALAGALAMRPRCIIFDEATAMLDPIGRRKVRERMARLHREGMTMIFITHFMEEAALADRVVVLNQGRVVMDGSPAQVFVDPQQLKSYGLELPPVARLAYRLRRQIPALPPNLQSLPALIAALPVYPGAARSPAEQKNGQPKTPAIEVSHLGHTYLAGTPFQTRALEDANLTVNLGSAHALLGQTGSGKSTLIQHLNGLLRPQSGRIRVLGRDLSDEGVDVVSIRRRVGLVFQNPEMQFFEQFAGDEIAFGPRTAGLADLRERVRWAMEVVGLDFEKFKDRLVFTLSGGERRKVALASTLALRPEVLLLDEPTAGLDPGARRELLTNLLRLQENGMTLVLSSHQMDDVAVLARQITVFDRGRDVMDGPSADIFNRVDALVAVGMETPNTVLVARALRERGWAIDPGVVTPPALEEAVRRELELA